MIALVCDTPYQLMSAIMVSREIAPAEPMVFFINKYLYNKEQTFDYKSDHPLVENVLYYGRAHMSPAKLLPGLLKPGYMLKSIEGYNPDYEFSAIIASRTAYMATYIMKESQKRGKNIPVYIIEEGADEYTNKFTDTRFTKVCRTLRQPTHIDRVDTAFFSAPHLYPYKPDFPVKKVPALNNESKEIITSVFNLEKINEQNPLNPYKCIILSQPEFNENNNPADTAAFADRLEEITDLAAASAGFDDTVIKVHPIDPGYKKEGANTYFSKLPMESLVFSLNTSSKFFISAISTAMLTPKLLFDYEPGLIFTYKIMDPLFKKLVKNPASLDNFYAFAEKVMSTYRNPRRCAVPETMEELADTVKRFSEELPQVN